MKVDKSVINSVNKRNVLEIIRNNSPISKTEISKKADLTLPTVMKIVDELAEKNLVLNLGKGVSSGGKPPQMLEFNGEAYYIIGIDVNDYRIDAIIMDLNANIITERIRDIQPRDSSSRIIEYIKELISHMISEPTIDNRKILGIGIGILGLVNTEKGKVVYSSAFNWRDADILMSLKRSFPYPVILDNGTRAMAMGEKIVGHARDVQNFVCINFGYGIDSAIVMDGSLYYGNAEVSGSLGHVSVKKDGPLCVCGNIGCLDTIASPNAMVGRAKELVCKMPRGKISQMLNLVYGDVDQIDIYTILEAAENGDETACSILIESAEYLAMAVASLMNIVDPEVIILEGKILRSSKLFLKELMQNIKGRKMKFTGELKMEFSDLGKHVGAIGAASFILDNFLKHP